MKNKKIVWITGASSGIGEELSYKFAQKGWKTALTARRKDKLEKINKKIGNENLICPADVSYKSDVKKAFKILERKYKNIDLAILNAGVYITLKELRNDHDTSTVVLVTYALSALILLIPNLIVIPQLSMTQFLGLCLMSSVGFVGKMGMTLGFKFATAGISSLLMLSIIPFTSLSGMIFFDESLNIITWVGISLVVAALSVIGKWQ